MDSDSRLLANVVRERAVPHGPIGIRLRRLRWLLAGLAVTAAAVLAVQLVRGPAPVLDRVGAGEPLAPLASGAAEPSIVPMGTPTSERNAGGQPVQSSSATVHGNYVVRPGDTLRAIAEHSGLSPATLAAVNELSDPDLLQVGQRLTVPATDGVVHTVRAGESLRSIAELYDVDIGAILATNDLPDADNVAVGLRLFVPKPRATADR